MPSRSLKSSRKNRQVFWEGLTTPMGQSPTLGWLLSCPIRYWWWSLSWELICRNTEFQKQKLIPHMFCVRLHVSRFFLALNGVIWMATWPLWWRMDSVLRFISALCEGGKEAYSFSSSPSGPWLKGFFFFLVLKPGMKGSFLMFKDELIVGLQVTMWNMVLRHQFFCHLLIYLRGFFHYYRYVIA